MTTLRPVAALGTLVMIAAIAAVWGFQLIGGYLPCELCLEQRVPYYVAIPLALVALGVSLKSTLYARVLLVAAAACMVWAAGLGVYHAGAEWEFWQGPNTCGGTAEVRDAGNLLAQLQTKTFVSCNVAAGRFLGISFAGWNVVAAAIATVLLFVAAWLPARRAGV